LAVRLRRWSSVKRRRRAAELSPQDAILFAQVFDRVPLLLVHPTGDRNEEKSERVQALWHRFAGYNPCQESEITDLILRGNRILTREAASFWVISLRARPVFQPVERFL
jgi:hypothetical protein